MSGSAQGGLLTPAPAEDRYPLAVFEHARETLVARIVYDGPGFAGKTTNLQALAAQTSPTRRGALQSPNAREGRTLYFDWLEIQGGLIEGLRLETQLVSVPGQGVFAERRWLALESADAVVFVTPSTREGVRRSKPLLEALLAHIALEAEQEIPVILQANMQDREDALTPLEVRRALGLDPSVRVVGASARSGLGVRETAAHAMRAAALGLAAKVRAGALDALVGRAETCEELLGAMAALPLDLQPSARPVPRGRRARPVRRAPSVAPLIVPPLPTPELRSDRLFPASTVRELLRRIPELTPEGSAGATPREAAVRGRTRSWILESGMWRLETTSADRFDRPEDALAEVGERLAWHRALGELAPPKCGFALAGPDGGPVWLWRVGLGLSTLEAQLGHAEKRGDRDDSERWLTIYATAAEEVQRIAALEGRAVRVSPKRFGVLRERCHFLGMATRTKARRRRPNASDEAEEET